MLRIMPEFVLGMALYYVSCRKPWTGSAVPAYLTLVALLLISLYMGLPDYISILTFPGIIYVAAGSSLKPVHRKHTALVYCGEISYSFYMIHVLVLYGGWRLFEIYGNSWLWIIFSFSATLALSAAAYNYIERPAREALRRLSNQ
jgi:exopolysaccharide production protein ExoZ